MIKVLLVDDEELARLRLRTLLSECALPRAEVVGEAGTVAHALVWLAEHRCDLILLDIQMPGADGMQLAAALRLRAAQGEAVPAVVFVTAHAQHALRAFELEATDYLTKPVRRERLQATLTRVAQRLPAEATGAATPTRTALTSETSDIAADPATGAALVVSERGKVVRVRLDEVLYLKAELKYVTLRTAQHTYVLDDALSDLEQRLGERFMRVHRNALVSRKAVSVLERRSLPGERDEDGAEAWAVRVEPVGEWLAVSRRQVAAVREAIAQHGI
ncbi:LytTR family DNA-binding domain-containing protein [soil metagenome]